MRRLIYHVFCFGGLQGGSLVLEAVVRRAVRKLPPLGGAVAISGSMLAERLSGPAAVASEAPRAGEGSGIATPVLITHGDADDVLPRQQVLR